MSEITYYYDGSFAGFLSCVFESYARHETPAAMEAGEDPPLTLFDTRTVPTDEDRARRVLRKLKSCSPYGANLVCKGFLTCLPNREVYLYRVIVKLLSEGSGFLRNLSDETLFPVAAAVRHLNTEAHLLKGFVRFSDLGGVLGGEIEPKNRVLPLLRAHFRARYREEAFFLYDRTHREALFCAHGRDTIRPLEDFQMAPPDTAEARYRTLWKRFYDTIAIRERENPRCRMTHMPKRYWGTMTEFQDADWFRPGGGTALESHASVNRAAGPARTASQAPTTGLPPTASRAPTALTAGGSFAAGPAPAAPDGTPVPERP